jgi:uncharacterized membrane protein YdbT with pleckstrin-like domain
MNAENPFAIESFRTWYLAVEGAASVGYIEKHLISGETVLYKTRLHSVAVLFPLLLAVVLAAGGAFCLYEASVDRQADPSDARIFAIAGLVLLVVAGVTLIVAIMKRNSTEMAVTSRRVLIKSGIMSRRTIEMLLSKIESVVITEPFLGRMLGYGTVVIRGTGGTPEPFYLIANPVEFRRHVQEQIEARQADTRPGTPLSTEQ